MFFNKPLSVSASQLTKVIGWSVLSACALTLNVQAQTTGTPAPSMSTPPSFSTYANPFAAQSLWNVRPVNPVLDTSYTIPTSSYYPDITAGAYSTGLFLAKETDLPMKIYGTNGANLVNNPDAGGNTEVTLPRWPANTLPASGSDGHADIYDPVTNVIHSFWKLKNVNGKWQAGLYAWSPATGTGWGDPAHFYLGARATGVPASAGLIRAHEINDGLPMYRHALAMSLTYNALSATEPYVYPATSADGDAAKTNSGKIPQGALMMLPANYDTSKIANLALRKVAETLKTYGAYVVDRNVGTPFVIYVETGNSLGLHAGGWNNAVAAELERMRQNMRRVIGAQSWQDGTGKAFDANTPNLNALSMRGPWIKNSGTVTGAFDTWSQSIVFPASPVKTIMQNGNSTGLSKIKWGAPVVGSTQQLKVIGTGGATLRMALYSGGTMIFDTGTQSNGYTKRFVWPTGAWFVLYASNGLNQASSVRGELVTVELAPATIAANAAKAATLKTLLQASPTYTGSRSGVK